MKNLLIFSLSLLLTSCGQQEEITTFSGTAMTMDYRILVAGDVDMQAIEKLIQNSFSEIDKIHNKWNPQSELSKLNSSLSLKVSPSLLKIVLLADKAHKLSDGRFDPTIEPLQNLWKQKLAIGQIPSNDEIADIASHIGWKHIRIINDIIYKDDRKIQLDLGGIAKGYAIDLIKKRINDIGYPNCYVEWGGEVSASGKHPSGRPWTVFISRLGQANPEDSIALVTLENQAIATSGDYLQNWTVKNKVYFHIFDPITLNPLSATKYSVASASVRANTCAFADALATAAMMFETVEESEGWLRKVQKQYPEISFWVISRSNKENDGNEIINDSNEI